MHIIVFIASEIRENCRFYYSDTIVLIVIVNKVESAKTWCQYNSNFNVVLNRHITNFRKLNIYNLFIERLATNGTVATNGTSTLLKDVITRNDLLGHIHKAQLEYTLKKTTVVATHSHCKTCCIDIV